MSEPALAGLATELRSTVDGLAAEFGTGASVTVDGRFDCAPSEPGTSLCWQYGVRLRAESGTASAALLDERIAPLLTGSGWQEKHRDNPHEYVRQFSRDGADVNVQVARAGAEPAGVSVIGSTRCVEIGTGQS